MFKKCYVNEPLFIKFFLKDNNSYSWSSTRHYKISNKINICRGEQYVLITITNLKDINKIKELCKKQPKK